MAQKQMLMVMKRLLPALLAVVVVLSLSFVHVGLGADREGVGFKITLGSGKHPGSSEFYSLDRHGRSALSDINPIRCTSIVKLTDCRLFSAFLHEATPLKMNKAVIEYLTRFRSESG